MSTVPTPEKPAGDQPKPLDDAPQKGGGGVLRILLFLILFAVLGLGLLDLYSRWKSESAFESVKKWVEDPNKSDRSPEDIHKLIGRNPDRPIEDEEYYFIEEYSWRRGRLYDTYSVKVLYAKGDDDKPELHEVVMNDVVKEADKPSAPPPVGDAPVVTSGDETGQEGSGEENSGEENSSGDGEDNTDAGDDNSTGEDSDSESDEDSTGNGDTEPAS